MDEGAPLVSDVGGANNRYASIYYCPTERGSGYPPSIAAATSIALELVVEGGPASRGVRHLIDVRRWQPGKLSRPPSPATRSPGYGLDWRHHPRVTVNPQNGDACTDQSGSPVSTVYLASAYVIGVSSGGSRKPALSRTVRVVQELSTLVLSPAVRRRSPWSIEFCWGW